MVDATPNATAESRIGGTENQIEFLWKISQLDWSHDQN
jgi:hypothetical protein